MRLLVDRYERRTAQHEAISQLPLYPDETSPWDEAVVPVAEHVGDACLALPKLNLQFLTIVRGFSLRCPLNRR